MGRPPRAIGRLSRQQLGHSQNLGSRSEPLGSPAPPTPPPPPPPPPPPSSTHPLPREGPGSREDSARSTSAAASTRPVQREDRRPSAYRTQPVDRAPFLGFMDNAIVDGDVARTAVDTQVERSSRGFACIARQAGVNRPRGRLGFRKPVQASRWDRPDPNSAQNLYWWKTSRRAPTMGGCGGGGVWVGVCGSCLFFFALCTVRRAFGWLASNRRTLPNVINRLLVGRAIQTRRCFGLDG